tara:strand:+ start:329 stop:1468 length:1140 start_codon:yes stop_codon:yes gene_type:complete
MAGTLVTTNIVQTAVAMGLDALRQQVVLPKIVNRSYEDRIGPAARQGSTVNVAVPSAITTRSVTADVVPPAVTAVTPTSVSISLDQWKEAPFAMSDQAISQVQRGIIPMQMSEAVKSLANTVDDYLWSLIDSASGVYGYTATAGTTPFASNVSQYLDARAIANNQLMPMDNRFVILDADAEANALQLSAFLDASAAGTKETIVEGEIGYKLGARWLMSQNVATHTETNSPTGWLVNDASVSVGDTTITVDTGSGAPVEGDIFSVAGSTQTYQVSSATSTVITMTPSVKFAYANNAALTFKGSYVENLLLHRDLIGFAMAPLMETEQFSGGSMSATAVDEDSGLALRLEITRQYKQYQWSYDVLYGGAVIRPELGVIIAG